MLEVDHHSVVKIAYQHLQNSICAVPTPSDTAANVSAHHDSSDPDVCRCSRLGLVRARRLSAPNASEVPRGTPGFIVSRSPGGCSTMRDVVVSSVTSK